MDYKALTDLFLCQKSFSFIHPSPFVINTTTMSTSRKNSLKKDRNQIAVQSSPTHLQLPHTPLDTMMKSDAVSRNKRAQVNLTKELIRSIEKVEAENNKKQEMHEKGPSRQGQRIVTLNLMRLKDKSFKLDKNIYNIAIGEVASRDTYLASLHEQIEELKSKIQSLEDQEIERMALRTIDDPLGITSDATSDHQHKKPVLGRIYSRESSPIFNKNSTPKHQRAPSPKNQRIATAHHQNRSIQAAEVPYIISKHKNQEMGNQKQEYTKDTLLQKRTEALANKNTEKTDSEKNKFISQYRIKQKKITIDSNSIQPQEIPQTNQSSSKNIIPIQIKAKQQEQNLGQSQNHQQQTIEDEKQPSINQEPEQLKQIFLDNPQWQITSINDDFRAKMTQKLQIPQGLPIPAPDPTDPLELFQKKAAQIYSIFNIDISKCKNKVATRKFKNGIYYQLRPNKNIVWYFNGSLYFGEWDNELPNDAEKNGFGLEYVPNKYYYLGGFTYGNRSGKGVIKIMSNSGSDFMGFDGEWLNGKPHGFGKHIDDKNNKYIGSFEKGEKVGKAVMLSKDGVYYQGDIKNGLKHGKGVEKMVNGDAYIGNFSQGKFSGKGSYKWNNGSTFEGDFVKGKREGKGVWISCNGDKFEGEYSNDLKHGWGKFTWKNGQIYEGEFKDDIRHGKGYYKHPKGKIGKYLWKDGHIDHRLEDDSDQSLKRQQK